MNIGQVTAVCFSPTGSTKRVMEEILKGQAGAFRELDLTDAKKIRPEYYFLENEVIFVGAPVYGGRIPAAAKQRFKKLHGYHTPAVLVVTYGNRDYDDALLELKDQMEAQGFVTVAAAAVVTRHNIVTEIAEGRPDQQDLRQLAGFSARVSGRLAALESAYQIKSVTVTGSRPYCEHKSIPVRPRPDRHCSHCGLCIRKCPVQAISITDAAVIDEERCISCMRCAAVCPVEARKLGFFIRKASGWMLKKKCRARREVRFFFETIRESG